MRATRRALKLTEHRGPFCVIFLRRDGDRGPFHALKHTHTHTHITVRSKVYRCGVVHATQACFYAGVSQTNTHVHMEQASQTTCGKVEGGER